MNTKEKLEFYHKSKEDINAMWASLYEQKDLAAAAYVEGQEAFRRMSEHSQAMAALYIDIADKVKEVVAVLTEEVEGENGKK